MITQHFVRIVVYIDCARSSYDGSLRRTGVDLSADAESVDAHTVSVNGELIRATDCDLSSSIPTIPGAELGGGSDDVFAWEELPESVVILGAGYITELAGVLPYNLVFRQIYLSVERPLRGFDSYIVESLGSRNGKYRTKLHTHKVPAT